MKPGKRRAIRSGIAAAVLCAALSAALSAIGAEGDRDGDGVSDLLDECPDSAARANADGLGCPLGADADADGVPDAGDNCPRSPSGAIVDPKGCAADRDTDGVADGLDRCESTPAGLQANADGCAPAELMGKRAPAVPAATDVVSGPKGEPELVAPDSAAPMSYEPRAAPGPSVGTAPAPAALEAPVAIAEEPVVAAAPPAAEVPVAPPTSAPAPAPALPLVTAAPTSESFALPLTLAFDAGSKDLSADAMARLERALAELKRALAADDKLKLQLVGHADRQSEAKGAEELSERRAWAVHRYLAAQGIAASRLRVAYRGSTEPQGSDSRRVEIRKLP